MKSKSEGFTLLEVAIAGAILLMGMVLVANVTRTLLDSTAPDSPQATQNSAVIEQYLRAELALLKSCRDGANQKIPDQPYGNGVLRVDVTAPIQVGTTPPSPNSGYNLMEYDVQVNLLQPGQPAVLVAHTKFWKLWRSTYDKAGI